MARTFDGVDDKVTVSIGATDYLVGPGTVCAIATLAADGTLRCVFNAGNSTGGSNRWNLRVDALSKIDSGIGSTNLASPTLTIAVADGWVLFGWSKATGSVKPRYYKYVFASNSFSAEDGASNIANSTAPGTSSVIGARVGAQFWSGDIALVGIWNAVLTDAQIQALAFSLGAWFAVAPKGLWLLDQAATGQKVLDLSGGGANESAIVGTSVGVSSVPVFSYGASVRRRNAVGVVAAFIAARNTPQPQTARRMALL